MACRKGSHLQTHTHTHTISHKLTQGEGSVVLLSKIQTYTQCNVNSITYSLVSLLVHYLSARLPDIMMGTVGVLCLTLSITPPVHNMHRWRD